MLRRATVAVAVPLVALLLALVVPPAVASAQPANGTVRVTVRAPEGVPANVVLTADAPTGQVRQVAVKPPAGTSTTVVLTLPLGAARVSAPRVVADGVAYVPRFLLPAVPVVPRTTTTLDVEYVAEGGATGLRATAVDRTSVSLAWTAPPGSVVTLRRTTGGAAAATPTQGVNVPVSGTTAVDKGLTPGTQYAYALFTTERGRRYGPLTAVAGTAPPAGSTDAAYIASPSTLLAKAADIASARTTGTGVEVVLQAQVTPPVAGAGVVLPVSPALPGGFLGVVTKVSPDGRTVALTAGGLGDAFDFYELNVTTFGDPAAASAAPSAAAPSAAAAPGATATQKSTEAPAQKSTEDPAQKSTAPGRRESTPEERSGGVVAPSSAASASAKAAPGPSAKAAAVKCNGDAPSVTFTPLLQLGGSFSTKVETSWTDVKASVDAKMTATLTGAAQIKTSASYACTLDMPPIARTISASPVPLSAVLTPSANFSADGAVTLTGIGMAATAGVQVNGTMSLKNKPSVSGSPIATVTPLTPSITANGTVALRVAGELLVGPGVATPNTGAVAGLSGELSPLDATFSPEFSVQDARFNACLKADAALTVGLGLTARAWVGKKKLIDETITIDALNKSFAYPGSPFRLPKDCDKLPGGGSPNTLLGPGVTKVDDTVVGDPAQWDHVDGFAPGAKTWVLSSGVVADAVGTPDKFASRNMGRAGDPELTALAGHPTYDAATYQVTLVPTGKTLHVRYVFASEEYPDYVGSQFNDVMVVRVDGKNCAFVPGTTTPVAINTVNAKTNSTYFVDNATGAAGYGTTMNGLTKPLTCDVPVTPGKAVTVQIAVADTSDRILDSAVALVDGGIWTD